MEQNRLLRQTAVEGVVAFILAAALACSKETPPTPSPALSQVEGPGQSAPQAAASVASVPPATSQVEGVQEKEGPFDGAQGGPAVYQSRGRCDPFRPPRKLMGIIWKAHSSYALMESCASPGIGYVIRENDIVDSAKVVKITRHSVVLEVQTKNSEGKLTRNMEQYMLSGEAK